MTTNFWDRIALKYSKQPIADEAAYQQKLKVTRSYFRPDMELLEIGCGTGGTVIKHAPHVKHIHAIDISAKMIEIAEERKVEAQVNNVSFEQATMEDFQAPDKSLDMVLALSLLHLLEDKEGAITKIYTMLKPGGIFVSSTACLGKKFWWLQLIAPIGRWFGVLPLVKFFTPEQLRQVLVDAGFIIDYQRQPAPNKAVFIVAKKPE